MTNSETTMPHPYACAECGVWHDCGESTDGCETCAAYYAGRPQGECTACLIAADTVAVILSDGTTAHLCWDCAMDTVRAWDYCPACDRPTVLSAFGACVPGDGNSESVCPSCAARWQASHVWDDALGEWVEADPVALADAAIDAHWRYCATRNPDACPECDALFAARADAHPTTTPDGE